ncbi:MAG: hypothetical protein WCI00_09750 [bacterium]
MVTIRSKKSKNQTRAVWSSSDDINIYTNIWTNDKIYQRTVSIQGNSFPSGNIKNIDKGQRLTFDYR